jgi:hypothetical protein
MAIGSLKSFCSRLCSPVALCGPIAVGGDRSSCVHANVDVVIGYFANRRGRDDRGRNTVEAKKKQ